jgi:hypothetical protein
MKTTRFIAYLSSGPGPECAVGARLMARRLQNNRERSPSALQLLLAAAAAPRLGIDRKFTSSGSKGLFR